MISIVVPCYNHANALPALLQSMAKQTYTEFEVIVVDDGSIDNPCAVVNNLSKIFSFPLQCYVTKNQGAPAARNFGASKARGEYLLFADADLVMQPNMLERLLETLHNNPQASYAYSAFRFGWKKFSAVSFDASALRKMNYIHTSALIRRGDFVGFDESLHRFQDWDLWLTMLANNKLGVAVPEMLFTARVMRIGISKWRPSFWYTLWPIFGYTPPSVLAYNRAKQVIMQKHSL